MVVVSAVFVALLSGLIFTGPEPTRTSGEGSTSFQATTILLHTALPRTSNLNNLATIARLATLGEVPARVATALRFSGSPAALAAQVQVEAEAEAGLLNITARGSSSEEAKAIADRFAVELIGFLEDSRTKIVRAEGRMLSAAIERLSQEIADLDARIASAPAGQAAALRTERDARSTQLRLIQERVGQLAAQSVEGAGIQVLQEAVPRRVTSPDAGGIQAPRSRRSRLAIAGAIGLIAGIGMALLLERVDTRIWTKEAAEQHFGLPVLAEIPHIRRSHRRPATVITVAEPRSTHADAFRLLAAATIMRLSAAGNGSASKRAARNALATGPGDGEKFHERRTLLVTGPGAEEGKSTVVANLAATFAELGRRVLVISCDFRLPRVHELFQLPNRRGLAEALASADLGGPVLEGIVRNTPVPGVRLVTSGAAPASPGQLLGSENMRRALIEAREQADVVLLDTGPIFHSDAAHLLSHVDAVLVVARAGKTRAQLAERTGEILVRLGAPAIGVTLNGTSGISSSSRDYPRHGPEADALGDQRSAVPERRA